MVGGVAETQVECSMTGGGCGVADYAVGALTAGVAHRLSTPNVSNGGISTGIYEFEDLMNPGMTYVGQSQNIPNRLQQHIDAARLASIDDAIVTPISGNKFLREIAEQNRITQLGGIPGGTVSNIRNPIGQNREWLALQNGLEANVIR